MVYNYTTGRQVARKRDIAQALASKAAHDAVSMPWGLWVKTTSMGVVKATRLGVKGMFYTGRGFVVLTLKTARKTTWSATYWTFSWMPFEIHWKRSKTDGLHPGPHEQEKLTKYVKETLPLDRDGKDDGDDGLSVSGVKERVIVNGKKVVGKVVPESVQTVAGKSAAVAGSAMGALSTAYNGMTKENLKNTYNKCTVENAKKVTKGAYNECTAENAKKVALVTKAVVDGSIATTKAVVGGTVAATKTTVKVASKTIDTTVKVAGKTIDTTVKVAGKTIDTAVKAKNYAVGARAPDVDAPEAEPETPVAEVD